MVVIRLDYNAETDDGQFFAQRSRLGDLPAVGQVVPTRDSDGNGLNVIVDRTENGLVYFEPLWSTWCAAEDPGATELTSASAFPLGRESHHRPRPLTISTTSSPPTTPTTSPAAEAAAVAAATDVSDDDDALVARVEAKLLGGLTSVEVEVEAVSGVVTLRGQVADEEAEGRFVRDAEQVEGVKAVQSELQTAGAEPGSPSS